MLSNFQGNEAKKSIFFFKMADSKKLSFSTTNKSWAISSKISWIGPWVIRIDWCEGQWCGSTYMVVRMSDVSSKTDKKCIFCGFRLFLSLRPTASSPYRLSHINALCINESSQPKDQSMNFWEKLLSFCWWLKIFESAILKKKNFFLLHSLEN